MSKVNVFEVKAKLSAYLDRVIRGEEIIICRHNRPVAELRALDQTRTQPRPLGPLPGRPTFEVPASFFEPLPDDELELWDAAPAVSPVATTPRAEPRAPSRVAEKKTKYRRGRAAGRRPRR